MGYPGTWMTQSESMIYRVVPKCACSTIGQILYWSDHGRFYDGDIHDAQTGVFKWGQEHAKAPITQRVQAGDTYTFTCVRNPYSRLLSCFFDKICGIQRNGTRYRSSLLPDIIQSYGIDVGGDDATQGFDQIKSFRRFLLFVRDTLTWHQPIGPDIHWSPVSGHIGTLIAHGGRYDHIMCTEAFEQGLAHVQRHVAPLHPVDPAILPRFNQSARHGPTRDHPVEAYFDDLSIYIMSKIYAQDFLLFKYDANNPSHRMPTADIDLAEIHAALTAPHA